MKNVLKLSLVPLMLLAGACFAPIDEPTEGAFDDEGTAEDGAELVAPGDQYFVVTRPDFRKCIYPLCGGDFVKAVNHKYTQCFEGKKGKDCYVGDYDFSALGLDPASEQALNQAVRNGQALVLGHFEQHSPQFPVARLVVNDAWLGVSGDDPDGRFYDVNFNGVVCVTFPCPSYDAQLLNSNKNGTLAGVDLTQTSATAQQVQDGYNALQSGIILAGKLEKISGPAGTAKGVVASEFYSYVPHILDGEVCGNNVCGKGFFCCNASCGICAPQGYSCIQIACNPTQ